MAGADILQFPMPQNQVPAFLGDAGRAHLSVNDLQLENLLYETLDLQNLLERFIAGLREEYSISGLQYKLPESNEEIVIGRVGRSGREYQLRYNDNELGSLIVGSIKGDDQRLTEMLSLLNSPLHNALSFHRIKQAASRDPLSGLGNRLALESALSTEAARSERHNVPFTMLVIDIDHFKRVNDELGHTNGDKAIQGIAIEVRHLLRAYDQAFRFGGEEFVVILSQTPLSEGLRIAERIRQRIAEAKLLEKDRQITVSIGAAEYAGSPSSVAELFERADSALYEAKRSGRNQVRSV